MGHHVALVAGEHLVTTVAAERDLEIATDLTGQQVRREARRVAKWLVMREQRIDQPVARHVLVEYLHRNGNAEPTRGSHGQTVPRRSRAHETRWCRHVIGVADASCGVGSDEGGVNAPGQEQRDRDVALEVLGDRAAQQRLHLLARLVYRTHLDASGAGDSVQ